MVLTPTARGAGGGAPKPGIPPDDGDKTLAELSEAESKLITVGRAGLLLWLRAPLAALGPRTAPARARAPAAARARARGLTRANGAAPHLAPRCSTQRTRCSRRSRAKSRPK